MGWLRSNRRSFLKSLAALPGFGAAAASSGCSSPAAAGRDVAAELGVRTFLNAAGTYTTLTASLMPPEVVAAIQVASRKFVPLNDLHDAVGRRIAELVRGEAAMVSAGCASALSLATAACVAGSDKEKIRRLPEVEGMKSEVIIQKSHRNGYDHAVRNTGVTLVEVETREELEAAVNERTAMLLFFNKSDPDGQIKRAEWVELGRKFNVPTLNDAAADLPPVENLWRFTEMGFDLVAFSGGKGLCGPQSAGLLIGRKDLIEAARMNNNPNSDSLCRTNKVNKEELIGMLVALELFVERDHEAVWKDWEARCETIGAEARKVAGVETEVFIPEISNAVPHLRIRWDYEARGLQPKEAAEKLRRGEPGVEVRPGETEDLEVAVWMLQPGEDAIVGRLIRETIEG